MEGHIISFTSDIYDVTIHLFTRFSCFRIFHSSPYLPHVQIASRYYNCRASRYNGFDNDRKKVTASFPNEQQQCGIYSVLDNDCDHQASGV